MRAFRLSGWDTFNNIVQFEKEDVNCRCPGPWKVRKKTKKQIMADIEEFGDELQEEEELRRGKGAGRGGGYGRAGE